MFAQTNIFLMLGAVGSFVAASLHIGIIIGGPAWYRFFGAGEAYAQAAARGELEPAIVTAGIATVLFIWGLYALKGAGALPALPLPFLRFCLSAITAIFVLRGLVLIPSIFGVFGANSWFWIWSSLICLSIGVLYAVGLWQRWRDL